ncbi:MAG: PorT family protein [Deltaproteobacteria bacterium]|nr:PorT family protein [Deltaproteobacteria bacterium]
MKKIAKILLVLVASLLYLQSSAQTFGLKAGLNMATMFEEDDYDTYSNDYSMNPGFHLGLTVGVPFNDFLSFESGLLLETKGMKYEDNILDVDVVVKANLFYLDIPLTLRATTNLESGLKLYGAVGPYVGIGLSGKLKAKAEYQGETETEEEDINWGNDEDMDDLKRIDMGLTFGGGIEINAITLGISYDLGLSNISSYQDEGTTSQNRVLRFSVGYMF